MTAPGEPQFVPGAAVTPALARELGPPRLGQWFVDDTSAVISTSLWRRLGGGPEIIGRAITLDERQYTISGVMPPTFQLPLVSLGISGGETEVWIPLDPSPPDASRGSGDIIAYARRKPGVSLEQAQADVRRVATIVAAEGSGTLSVLHGGRGRPARGDDRDGRLHRPRPAADPARRRRPPAAHCLRQRGHAVAGAIRRPRSRDGDPRRARRVATAACAALLRRGRARVGRRRRRRRRSERDLRPADPGCGVRIHLARRRYRHRLDCARLQRGGGGRHRRARRPGAALAGDPHGAERGALRRRSRISRRAGATPVEGVRRRRDRARLRAPDDVGHSRRSHAQSRTRVVGLRPRRPRRVQPRSTETRRRNQ